MGDSDRNLRLSQATFGELTSSLDHLSNKGVTLSHFDRLRKDPGYRRRVARAFTQDQPKSGPISVAEATELMSRDRIFSLNDWSNYFGVKFDEQTLENLSMFPWGEDVLDAPDADNPDYTVAQTHSAFIGLSALSSRRLTVAEWVAREQGPEIRFVYYDFFGAHQSGDPFLSGSSYLTQQTCQLAWYLVADLSVRTRRWEALVNPSWTGPRGYRPLTAIEAVTQSIIFARKQGGWTRIKRYTGSGALRRALCSDAPLPGYRLSVELKRWMSPEIFEFSFTDVEENNLRPDSHVALGRVAVAQ